jgi:hypothetical protein
MIATVVFAVAVACPHFPPSEKRRSSIAAVTASATAALDSVHLERTPISYARGSVVAEKLKAAKESVRMLALADEKLTESQTLLFYWNLFDCAYGAHDDVRELAVALFDVLDDFKPGEKAYDEILALARAVDFAGFDLHRAIANVSKDGAIVMKSADECALGLKYAKPTKGRP